MSQQSLAKKAVSPWLVLGAGAALILAAALPDPALGQLPPRQPVPQFVGSVTVAQPLYWDGELFVESAVGPAALVVVGTPLADSTCADPSGLTPCWAYQFEVAEAADTLRIAMDLNTREDCFLVEVFEPDTYEAGGAPVDFGGTFAGLTHCPEIGEIAQLWNKEVFFENPQVGIWTVRVVPHRIDNLGFRFRAALENPIAPVAGELLPNLVPYPAYEFTFVAPANPLAGLAFDHMNPPGPEGISCTPDEREEAAEDGVILERCLRFSFGLYNAGPGDLDIQFDQSNPLGGNATQRIHAADGTVVQEVPAGGWEFHVTHGHPHYVGRLDDPGFVVLQLYRVLDPQEGTLEFVSSGSKKGLQPVAQRFFLPWESLDRRPLPEGCLPSLPQICLGLPNGWGDHYRWQRPGNHVPFDLANPDGDYVVRFIIDRDELVVESDDTDNVAYAWIKVVGEQPPTICERGLGLSPWDPFKVVHQPSFWLGTPGGTTADSAAANCTTDNGEHQQKVTGGGQIEDAMFDANGDLLSLPAIVASLNGGGAEANFGFVIHEGAPPTGNLHYRDHGTGDVITVTSYASLEIIGTHARFTGLATVNGVEGKPFEVDVDDLCEPGSEGDTFSIRILELGGYVNGGPLIGGNIQIHD